MNASEIIKAAYPEADDRFVDYVLWNRTPFPCASIPAKDLYSAARRAVRAADNGINLCDHCDNKTDDGGYNCNQCSRMMESSDSANDSADD